MKKRTRQWLWFIGLYIISLITVATVSTVLRYLIH